MFLDLAQLSVSYPDRSHPSVDNVSLGLHAGEMGVLIGPSGCGKTTLLRAVAGLERASAGEIGLAQSVVSSDSVHVAPEARRIVAAHPSCGVCLMHMQGEPRTMQTAPHYQHVVHEVKAALVTQAQLLEHLGVTRARISLDPGLGFGKTVEHNYQLLQGLEQLVQSGYPVVLGASRKSMIGSVTGKSVDQRLSGSIAAALAGVVRGAAVLRVHDVDATRDALKVWQSVQTAGDLH